MKFYKWTLLSVLLAANSFAIEDGQLENFEYENHHVNPAWEGNHSWKGNRSWDGNNAWDGREWDGEGSCNKGCSWCPSYCNNNLKLGISGLAFEVDEDRLDAFQHVTQLGTSDLAEVNHSRFKRPVFNVQGGVRGDIFYQVPCSNFEVGAVLTYLPGYAHQYGNVTATNKNFLVSNSNFNILSDVAGLPLTTVRSSWRLRMTWLDLVIARKREWDCGASFKPYFGARLIWQRQKDNLSGSSTLTTTTFRAILKEQQTGIGLLGGFWADWKLGCGFSVEGNFGGSIVYSKFRVHEHQLSTIGDATHDVSFKWRERRATPSLDLYAGVRYESCFCEKDFTISAGFEQHTFFDLNRFAGTGDLSASGVVVRLGFAL